MVDKSTTKYTKKEAIFSGALFHFFLVYSMNKKKRNNENKSDNQ